MDPSGTAPATPPVAKNRRRIRFFHRLLAYIITPVAIFAAWMLIARAVGIHRYHAVIAALHAAGRPTTVAELKRLGPQVDDAVQDAARAAWVAMADAGDLPAITPPDTPSFPGTVPSVATPAPDPVEAWIAGRAAMPPPALTTWRESVRPLATAARATLARGDVVLSGFGWLAPDARPVDMLHRITSGHAVYRGARKLAVWLRIDAAMSDDPAADLHDLAALEAAVAKPCWLLDAMVAGNVHAERDRCHVELAFRGTLPADDQERWLAEPTPNLPWLAAGYRGEPIFYGACYATEGYQLDEQSAWNAAGDSVLSPELLWAVTPGGCADWANFCAAMEVRLRGPTDAQRPAVAPNAATAPMPTTVALRPAVPVRPLSRDDLVERIALGRDADHRLARIAVRILAGIRAGAPAPSTRAGLLALLGDPRALAADQDHLALLVAFPAPGHLRLAIDPTIHGPDFAPDSLKAAHTSIRKAWLGLPPPPDALLFDRGDIELDVSGFSAKP